MGLNNGSGGGGTSTFVGIIGGSFVVKCEEDTPGAKKRILGKGPRKGEAIFEQHYRQLSGRLVDGKIHPTEYGENGLIKIKDDDSGETFILSIPSDNRKFTELCKRLPNIDPRMDVELYLAKEKDKVGSEGQPIYYMGIKQGDEHVGPAFTKDNPDHADYGEIPQAVKKRGKWDFSEQVDFLVEVFEKWFSENATEIDGNKPATRDDPPAPQDDDEIPF